MHIYVLYKHTHTHNSEGSSEEMLLLSEVLGWFFLIIWGKLRKT